jgi:hypothetical protein
VFSGPARLANRAPAPGVGCRHFGAKGSAAVWVAAAEAGSVPARPISGNGGTREGGAMKPTGGDWRQLLLSAYRADYLYTRRRAKAKCATPGDRDLARRCRRTYRRALRRHGR